MSLTGKEQKDMIQKKMDKIIEFGKQEGARKKEILFRKFKPQSRFQKRALSPEEQEVISNHKELQLSMSPPKRCPACGLKTNNLKEKGYPDGLLMFPIPNMGVCHFTCPKCFCVFMNKECFVNQIRIRKQAERKVQPAQLLPSKKGARVQQRIGGVTV